jgi:hypothetical protein
MRAKRDMEISQQTASGRRARQAATGSIRFYADTRILDNGASDAYTCTVSGATVQSYQGGADITCKSNELWSPSVRDYLKLTIIPTVISTFQALLNVERRTSPIQVASST